MKLYNKRTLNFRRSYCITFHTLHTGQPSEMNKTVCYLTACYVVKYKFECKITLP